MCCYAKSSFFGVAWSGMHESAEKLAASGMEVIWRVVVMYAVLMALGQCSAEV